jgi:hypothetical protein
VIRGSGRYNSEMANRPDDRLPESVVVVTNLNEDCSADASLTRHIKGRGSPVRAFMETYLSNTGFSPLRLRCDMSTEPTKIDGPNGPITVRRGVQWNPGNTIILASKRIWV